MARSPFTLAAAVTAALPGAEVVGVRPLEAGGDRRFDSAVVTLGDGREVAIRASTDEESAAELAAEAMALRALSTGARAVLPFAVPDYVGETRMADVGSGASRVLVTGFLPGFQIATADVPAGRGAAESMGASLAAVHALPPSVVRSAGLPDRDPAEWRAQLRTLVDRASSTGRVPARLTVRWREAMDADDLWRFEPAVVIGGAQATSFLFADDPDWGPQVTGMIGWHALSIGDPAADLAWLSSAPDAAADALTAYQRGSGRSPDAALASRARLLAELEFARWLVHGDERRRPDLVDDAAALLDALAEGLRGDDLAVIRARSGGVEQAMDALESVPEGTAPAVDTSMQTDTYDPRALWARDAEDSDRSAAALQETAELDLGAEDLDGLDRPGESGESDGPRGRNGPGDDRDRDDRPADDAGGSASGRAPVSERATAPVFETPSASNWDATDGAGGDEAQRAARAALNRWTSSSSE